MIATNGKGEAGIKTEVPRAVSYEAYGGTARLYPQIHMDVRAPIQALAFHSLSHDMTPLLVYPIGRNATFPDILTKYFAS